jgi:hypothetical protein
MPKMYSVSKKEWVDVPEAQVQQAYASGDFVFAKGERVQVALPDGRYGSVWAKTLARLLELALPMI